MAAKLEIKVPLLSVNDTVLTVADIPLENGSQVRKGDVILIFESSKTTYEVHAEEDGYIRYECETGRDYEVNDIVARLFDDAAEAGTPSASSPAKKSAGKQAAPTMERSAVVVTWEGETLFSNAALARMAEKGVDRNAFAGMAFVGRADVDAKLGIAKPATIQKKSKAVKTMEVPAGAEVKRLPASKRREIEYLGDVQSTGLTSTIHSAVSTQGIFARTNRSLRYFKNSLLPLVIYETSRLLVKYPEFNAYHAGDVTVLHPVVNIGFAIDIDKGLKVVRVADAATSNLAQIEEEMLRLSGKYVDDVLDITDLSDITFTVTDLSAEGVHLFRPLVNRMNSAILGISSIDDRLERCILSLTFDHRVTEGKAAAIFLDELRKRLESYRSDAFLDEVRCHKCMKSLREDLSDVGFSRCITPAGKDGYVCQSCLKGF